MEPKDLISDAFDRIVEIAAAAVADLTVDQLSWRPKEGNSIGWLVWHLTRVQDSHLAELAGSDEVYASDGFEERFDLPYEPGDTGYDHTTREVGAFAAKADLIVDYLGVVTDRSKAYLADVSADDLDEVVDEHWDPPVTRGVRLLSVVADDLQHAGQAAYVRGMLGLQS